MSVAQVAPAPVVLVAPPQAQTMSDQFLPLCTSLYISQTTKGWLMEHFGCQDTSEFLIYDGPAKGTHLYTLTEKSHCCYRMQCGTRRPFTMTFTDPQGKLYATFDRPFRLEPGAPCCQQEIKVTGAAGNSMGRAYMPFFCCVPTINTETSTGETKYSSEYNMCACSWDVPFDIKDAATGLNIASQNPQSGVPNAQIRKMFPTSLINELCTSVDEFSINFPIGATVEDKFGLIASAILLDYTYFESKKNEGQ